MGANRQQRAGDWQLNTIISALSGVPIDLTTNKNTAGLASGTQRPNLVPGQPPYLKGDPRFYLNPAAFAVPSPGQFGDVGRRYGEGRRVEIEEIGRAHV